MTQPPYFQIEVGRVARPVKRQDWDVWESYDDFPTARNRARVMIDGDATLRTRIRICRVHPLAPEILE